MFEDLINNDKEKDEIIITKNLIDALKYNIDVKDKLIKTLMIEIDKLKHENDYLKNL